MSTTPLDGDGGRAELGRLLRDAEMEIEGRLIEASNTTLRVILSSGGRTVRAVYKPVRGERPLWDFPHGTLAAREVAAYAVSDALGWDLVPYTVMRDGPLGPGSCQLWLDDVSEPPVDFVPADELPQGWLPIAAAEDEDGRPYLLAHADDPRLARLAAFDTVINNADRKGGHVLATPDERVYGVDHGVCFHTDDKLRTVLWGFAGRAVAPEIATALRNFDPGVLDSLLAPAEVDALGTRIKHLVTDGRLPKPPEDRHAIPWPPI
ncbi:SCO1664 family protein [Catellatospora bangladeshensis]|uniref:Phosphatidylinositol kinase n=1 Tax=Catellatospora bangladeshensis TaxID=310355 RepID=A0A8J3JJJ0_9ACTN|nr:SCO1664 family protein [Catellatospora bangladeshensis]GIF85967.1 phosphatidylinositol kinase [Catellatospora bangladeshensis]